MLIFKFIFLLTFSLIAEKPNNEKIHYGLIRTVFPKVDRIMKKYWKIIFVSDWKSIKK